jgi:anti-sigma regulatory factor (Ser/Thr protein kinase)
MAFDRIARGVKSRKIPSRSPRTMQSRKLLVKRTWQSLPGNVQPARRLARDIASEFIAAGLDLIEIAIGEACTNAVKYGSPRGPRSHFSLCCFTQGRGSLVFEVWDEGQGCPLGGTDNEDVPDLDIDVGRGLFMIRHIMDDVALEWADHGCIVRMIKHFDDSQAVGPLTAPVKCLTKGAPTAAPVLN